MRLGFLLDGYTPANLKTEGLGHGEAEVRAALVRAGMPERQHVAAAAMAGLREMADEHGLDYMVQNVLDDPGLLSIPSGRPEWLREGWEDEGFKDPDVGKPHEHAFHAGRKCTQGENGRCTECGVSMQMCNQCGGIGYHEVGCSKHETDKPGPRPADPSDWWKESIDEGWEEEFGIQDPGIDMSLYQEVKARRIPYDYHSSDLYLDDTPENRALCDKHGFKYQAFTDTRGQSSLDVPFAYPGFGSGGKKVKRSPKFDPSPPDAEDVVSRLSREECIRLLEPVGIQVYEEDSTEDLREAVLANLLDGTLSYEDIDGQR